MSYNIGPRPSHRQCAAESATRGIEASRQQRSPGRCDANQVVIIKATAWWTVWMVMKASDA